MRSTSEIEWELAKKERFCQLYENLDKESLKKLQNTLLDILIDFDLFCRENKLDYFIAAGTLIGARRDEGFIPWDDDVDVVMPRKDYEKLKTIEKKGKYAKYIFKDSRDCEDISLCGKFELKNVTYHNVLGKNFSKKENIYIDVLPIDFIPKNKILRLISGLSINFLKISYSSLRCLKKNNELLYEMSNHSKELKRNLYMRKILAIPTLIFGKQNILKVIHLILSLKQKQSEDMTIALGAKGYFNEILKEKDVFPTKDIFFEKRRLKAPKNPDVYLKNRYGDFMKIPERNEQLERLIRLKENWREFLL